MRHPSRRLAAVLLLVCGMLMLGTPARAAGASTYVVAATLGADGVLNVSAQITFDGAAPDTLTQRLAGFLDGDGDVRYVYDIGGVKATAGSRDLQAAVSAEDGYTVVRVPTKGVTEPYRMFTSRAEFRLTLRADNADQRLTARGAELGVVGSARARVFAVRAAELAAARETALSLTLTPAAAARAGLPVKADGQRRNVFDLLAYPSIGFEDLARLWPQIAGWTAPVREQIEIEAAYAGYLARQAADVAAFRKDEDLRLPVQLDYAAIGGLSNEVREKLAAVRPLTLGQASRIEGVTPGALTALLAHVRRRAA